MACRRVICRIFLYKFVSYIFVYSTRFFQIKTDYNIFTRAFLLFEYASHNRVFYNDTYIDEIWKFATKFQ